MKYEMKYEINRSGDQGDVASVSRHRTPCIFVLCACVSLGFRWSLRGLSGIHRLGGKIARKRTENRRETESSDTWCVRHLIRFLVTRFDRKFCLLDSLESRTVFEAMDECTREERTSRRVQNVNCKGFVLKYCKIGFSYGEKMWRRSEVETRRDEESELTNTEPGYQILRSNFYLDPLFVILSILRSV